MTHAIIRGKTPEPISGQFTDNAGIRYPSNALALMSPAELAAIDVYEVVEGAVPDGQVVTGWTLQWDGETVTRVYTTQPAPPPPVPASASPLQIRKALRQMGLKPAIDTFIAAQPEEVQEEWEYAVQIDRDNALIASAATALEKTDAEIDDLFRLAATL